ncbi:MAG: ABC transporter substrate-binding protein [Holosporaceae bacterium]|nr:ABC transporter substrate-binding protein [Holosporaceae bacterium]
MNKIGILLLILWGVLLCGCDEKRDDKFIKFGTSADYPPFEYYENGKIVGFEIELAQMIANELGKEVSIVDMPFDSILPSINNGTVDAGIAGFAPTEERKKNFDFSDSYYHDAYGVVYKKENPITNKAQMAHTKVGTQLGTTVDIWLKKHVPSVTGITMSNNNQLIEALKAGHVDCVFIGYAQCISFCEKNQNLKCSLISEANEGSCILIKKGSPLKDKLNAAIKSLIEKGKIQELKEKWFKWKK